MPQMAPMSWLLLMLTFVFSFLMFNSINYFSFSNNPIYKMTDKKSLTKIWSW